MGEWFWFVVLAIGGAQAMRGAVLGDAKWKRVANGAGAAVLGVICAGFVWLEWSKRGAVSSGAGWLLGVAAGVAWWAWRDGWRALARAFAVGVVAAAAGVGLSALGAAWLLAGWLGHENEAQAVKGEDMAAQCVCGAGSVCEGPRGGRFCVDADGKKRYLQRQ